MTDSMRYAWRRLVVRDPDLTDATRRVLLELESWADADGTNARPGIMKIATNVRTATGKHRHVSDRTVRSALDDGIERGYIALTFKAPRGRGNRMADVYRLTFPESAGESGELPCGCRELPATQTAGNSSGIAATQTAGIAGLNTGNPATNTGNSSDKYRQSGLPTTSPYTPDPSTPEGSSHLSNAGASTHEDAQELQEIGESAERETEQPALDDPARNPLAWIDNELPGGFMLGERARARDLLASGEPYSSVRFQILRERNARKRPGRSRDERPEEGIA
ncbi:helix-turn-helix domain-containing protein [Rhodococcus opacus]|uniref:helix-turn-helix domain-containing protein n=1 Tax=Rhodococcus opacus TaxID=37919 RepID=UPI001F5745DE|nr:helix-turn-helix domain-containing protein [Rhodococcus opacus]UNN00740.1 helix-turn-helix domain-containing protein [Rhodococcus opacus]